MKRIPVIALLTIALLSATTAALAQERAVIANVPFNFAVGDKWFPAGEYTISSPTSGVVQIQSADNRTSARVTATHSHQESNAGSQLVFNRYGDQYFLHQILCPSASQMNLNIPSWKLEKRARTREAMLQREDETLVAAR